MGVGTQSNSPVAAGGPAQRGGEGCRRVEDGPGDVEVVVAHHEEGDHQHGVAKACPQVGGAVTLVSQTPSISRCSSDTNFSHPIILISSDINKKIHSLHLLSIVIFQINGADYEITCRYLYRSFTHARHNHKKKH